MSNVIYWNDQEINFETGDTIAQALLRSNVQVSGPRALFCGIGQCQNCLVYLQGGGVAESCLTLCQTGMRVSSAGGQTQ